MIFAKERKKGKGVCGGAATQQPGLSNSEKVCCCYPSPEPTERGAWNSTAVPCPSRTLSRSNRKWNPESGSPPQTAKAAPQTGAARTQPMAKEKTLRTPRQPEHLPPDPHPLPDRPPWPPRNASNTYSAWRSDRRAIQFSGGTSRVAFNT